MASDNPVQKSTEAPSEEHIINCADYHASFSKIFTEITAHPHEQPALFLKQATIAADGLPLSLREQLLDFYLYGNDAGILLLTHCLQEPDIQDIPTPQGPSDKQSFVSECCLATIGARLGQVFGYIQIENGTLFHNIVPKPGMEHEQSSACSLVELQFHTEQHFHPHSPDYLLLYCLRNVLGAATFFASIRPLITELEPRYREILFEPLYRSGVDYVFGNTDTERGNGPLMSALYGNRNDPFFRYDQDLMVGVTPEARAALNALQSALEKITKGVCLNPGDLLVVDNKRVVHGRSPFKPQFNGKDRWLQRAKVMRDLDQAAADLDQSGHIVQTDFTADYN